VPLEPVSGIILMYPAILARNWQGLDWRWPRSGFKNSRAPSGL